MKIIVNEDYQSGYTYETSKPVGMDFDTEFKPELTPKEMLKLGIFGGAYFSSVPNEFPNEWFKDIELSLNPNPKLNYFKINASQSLEEWQKKGWIYFEDPLGWVLWYFRYFNGRRIEEEDKRQIKRWKAIKRHKSQVQKFCKPGDLNCRPKQRQALLHWAYDSRKF